MRPHTEEIAMKDKYATESTQTLPAAVIGLGFIGAGDQVSGDAI